MELKLVENETLRETLGILFTLLAIISYIPAIVLIFLRKKSQPIRHRSPYLLLISLFSSFLIQISLSLVIFLDPADNNNQTCFTCYFYIFNSNIMHFIIIFPYIFRSIRLMNIFNLKEIDSNYPKNKIREEYFLKWILCIFVFFLLLYFISYIMNMIDYVFTIELPICRTNIHDDMLLAFKLFRMLIHCTEIVLIFYSIFNLRSIRDEFKISTELIMIGGMWLTTETLFLTDAIFLKAIDNRMILIINILQNYLIVLISGLIPLVRSFRSLNIPVCTTKECASNFNLLIITERSYDCFYEYMINNMPEGAKLLKLWTELNVFKYSTNNEIKIFSTDIYYKYLNENSECYIDFPADIIKDLNVSYKNSFKNSYDKVFDRMAEFAYIKLKETYFQNFKLSREYKHLEKALETEEIIYSRLVASSMISSNEIE